MTAPVLFRGWFDPSELIIDNFAGGGGASTGIEAALGRPVDIAINHNPIAIAMHKINHPATKHFCENIWEVDPVVACAGRPVGLAWFSPDCTDFSRAKGGTPLRKKIRGLAWVVTRWARAVAPRVICVENVQEFEEWGPLKDGKRDPARIGHTFRAWTAKLRSYGYDLDFRVLVAADYGSPTIRRRLFLVARRDGAPIVWPEASHGKGRDRPWVPASAIIDWSIPCPSIFERRRPLAEATMRRIAMGIQRYVVKASNPFIVPVKTWGGGGNGPRSIDDPMRTVTTSKGGEFAIVEPFVVRHGHYSHRTGAGLREGCGAGLFRGQRLQLPLATVCGTNDKHLVAPIITKNYGGVVGHRCDDRPIGTVTGRDHHSLSAALLTKFYGTAGAGASVDQPMPTVTAGGGRGGGHVAAVQAFLLKYYGAGGHAQTQQIDLPLHTVTTKPRFGLVTVHGEQYQIVDIGLRMLQPPELFAANGFPPGYNIRPDFNGKPITKEAQTDLAGNAVCPQQAEALVLAAGRAA